MAHLPQYEKVRIRKKGAALYGFRWIKEYDQKTGQYRRTHEEALGRLIGEDRSDIKSYNNYRPSSFKEITLYDVLIEKNEGDKAYKKGLQIQKMIEITFKNGNLGFKKKEEINEIAGSHFKPKNEVFSFLRIPSRSFSFYYEIFFVRGETDFAVHANVTRTKSMEFENNSEIEYHLEESGDPRTIRDKNTILVSKIESKKSVASECFGFYLYTHPDRKIRIPEREIESIAIIQKVIERTEARSKASGLNPCEFPILWGTFISMVFVGIKEQLPELKEPSRFYPLLDILMNGGVLLRGDGATYIGYKISAF